MKKALSILLAVVMVMCMLPFSLTASAETTSGTTGDCTWTLDGTVLTISGNGKMEDFLYGASWQGRRVTKVVIEDGVQNIGRWAFDNCINLEEAIIPNSVTKIEDNAFTFCTSLSKVTLPNSITCIPYEMFSHCSSLESIVIPDSVTTIEVMAFWHCNGLESITIPNSVTSINGGAFFGCDKLTDIYFSGSKEDKEKMFIDEGNETLINATWHYGEESPSAIKYGLVTENEEISAADALLILQASVGKVEFTDEQKTAADVNGDGTLSAPDALLVLQYSVKKITKFPVEG